MAKSHDIHPAFRIGDRYGRLVIERELEPALTVRGVIASRRLLCRCDCGKEHIVRMSNLKSGAVQSCGCLGRELSSQRARKHGGKVDPNTLYAIWRGIKVRCYNPDHEHFDLYGGRGIVMCDEWRDDYAAFEAAAGERPSVKHTIDRIDTNGHYQPGNIRWATMKQQNRNRRNNRLVVYAGVEMPLSEASERAGLIPETVADRIKKGWPESRWFEPANQSRPWARTSRVA